MKQFIYTVVNPAGIDTCFAELLAKAAKTLDSTVIINKSDGNFALATESTALIELGIKRRDTIHITIEGGNEMVSATVMEQLFQSNL